MLFSFLVVQKIIPFLSQENIFLLFLGCSSTSQLTMCYVLVREGIKKRSEDLCELRGAVVAPSLVQNSSNLPVDRR